MMKSLVLSVIAIFVTSWSFAGGETGDILVTASGGSNPSLALSKDGETAYLVWVDMSTEEPVLLFTRVDWDKGMVGTPVRVNHTPGDVDFHHQASPLVRVGPEGNIYVAWQTTFPVEGRMFPASNLKFSRSTDGGMSFTHPIFVNDDHEGKPTSHTFHGMSVGPDGSVYLSWIDGRRAEQSKKAEQKGHGNHDEHHHHSEVGPDIRVARSVDRGRSVGEGVIVDSEACPCCRTAVTVGPRGEVYVAWRKHYPDNIRDIAFSRSGDHGLSFSAATRIYPDDWKIDGCPHHGPSLAVADDGEVHAAWYSGKEGAAGSKYAISADAGESFQQSGKIIYSSGSETSNPSMVLLPEGQALIATEEWDNTSQRIRVGLFSEQREEILSVPGKFPSMASNGKTCAVAWLSGESILVRHLVLPEELGSR